MGDVSQGRAHNFNDIRGKRFGRLFVLGDELERIPRHMLFVAQCDCGSLPRKYRSGQLVTGRTRSCGCLHQDAGKAKRTHFQKNTGTYSTWANMIQRCTNEKNPNWPEYGKRGVSVCERWRAFENFLEDMGPRPPGRMSLDRFPDKNGNYEPGNCRWATDVEQANNRRPRRWPKRPKGELPTNQ